MTGKVTDTDSCGKDGVVLMQLYRYLMNCVCVDGGRGTFKTHESGVQIGF